MKTNNDFNFFLPIDFEKANKVDKDGLPDKLIVTGVCSTKDEDSDGEELSPEGYELDWFLKNGFLNLEHRAKEDTSYIIGEPIDAWVKDGKMMLKGMLYKSSPRAVNVYNTAKMLQKEGSKRRLGYSIEGKALMRDPMNEKKILKARITHCAITTSPKNANTLLDIAKGEYAEPFVEPEFDETANGGAEYLLDVTRPDGTRVMVDRNFNITVNKAMSAGHQTGTELTGQNTSGAALKKESLRKKKTNLVGNDTFIKGVIKAIGKNVKEGKYSKEKTEKAKKFIKSLFL